MNGWWINVFCVALVALGVLAELNLLRVFLGDWLEGRREERRRFRMHSGQTSSAATSDTRRAVIRVEYPQLAACFLSTLVCPFAMAQGTSQPSQPPAAVPTAPTAATPPSDATATAESKSAVSVQINLDATTAYFYHGIVQEDSGLIIQPAVKVTINIFEQNDLKLDALLGTWNSFHGQKTGAQTHGDFSEYWYESDLTAGLVLTKDKWSLTTTYTALTSPSDAYETVQEVDLTLAYDDSDHLGKWALHPYALVGIEIGADASDGANSNTGTYLELGIAPGLSFDVGKTPVAITFPASVGLSLNDYYQDGTGDDELFGFAQVGVKASIPLPFGDRYGKWTLNAGVAAMYLGDHTAQYNGGEHEEVIGMLGLQVNF